MTSYIVFNYQAWVPCREILFRRLFNVLCITIAEELVFSLQILESFRFEDEDEDEDVDEAFCFRHNEIFKLFRLQLGRDDKVDCNNIITPLLLRI